MPSLFVIFQKDCHACRKQVKNLGCLKKYADIFLVGAFSNEVDLRKEYKIFGSDFKGLYGDLAFRKLFKIEEELTPQLVLGKNQKFKKILGAVKCARILQKLKEDF